jgi:hypothetical protein
VQFTCRIQIKYNKGTTGIPEIFHLAIGPQRKQGQFLPWEGKVGLMLEDN